MNKETRSELLSALATRTACTICHQEATAMRHHGNYRLDLHHEPVLGQTPLGAQLGHVNDWWYAEDYCSYFIEYTDPDGRSTLTLVRPHGVREDWTVRGDEARAHLERGMG